MSDLLPLVAAVLRDRVALDAQDEIKELQRQLETAQAVELIGFPESSADRNEKEPFAVYASAPFSSGYYHTNPNLFQVDLKTVAPCRLADLRTCRICVGGGFLYESLDDQQSNRAPYEGFFDNLEPDESRNNAKLVQFCFSPKSTWLTIAIHGWPFDDFLSAARGGDFLPEDTIEFLVESLATRFPEATVEFVEVAMVVEHIPAAMQRLLPPARLSEIERERDEWQMEEDGARSGLVDFVARVLREAGNQNPPAIFDPQVQGIIEFLGQLTITRVTDSNGEAISQAVRYFQVHGMEELERLVERLWNQP